MTRLAVRPMAPKDVENIVRYFYDASPADMDRMGIDGPRLPAEAAMRTSLLEFADIPAGKGESCCMIWEVDEQAVGFSTLKDITSECGGMHLHMWSVVSRGKGLGGELFCRSALEFYRLYDLPLIICEPRAANPMPNRMLQKVGFPLVRTYLGRSSALSAETELNRYEIRREIAEQYLARHCQLQ